MGLSSNQARFLSLTARQCDLEQRVQQICQRRLRLSSELENVATQYNNSISNRKLFIPTQSSLQNLSLDNLSALGFKVINTQTGEILKNRPDSIPAGQTVITSTEQFLDIVAQMNGGTGLNGQYVLACDIDLSGYDTGGAALINQNFTGSFDGNGYQISNLTINAAAGSTNVGIFNSIGGSATVKNLELSNIDINTGVGSTYTGALAGTMSGGNVSNIKVDGTDISGNTNVFYVGGLVGALSGGTISGCSVIDVSLDSARNVGGLVGSMSGGTVTGCETSGQVNQTFNDSNANDDTMAGGLIGAVWAGDVNNSWSSADVYTKYRYAGGITGIIANTATVSNCYATGDIKADIGPSGGFAGDIRQSSVITNCYATGVSTGGSPGGFYAWNSSGSGYLGSINNSFYNSTNYTGGNFGAGSDSARWFNSGALTTADIENKTAAFNTITGSWSTSIWDMTRTEPILKNVGYSEYVEDLEANLRSGQYSLIQYADEFTQSPINIDSYDYEEIDWRTLPSLNDELYNGDDTDAENKYDKIVSEINAQDKKLQLEQTSVETEYKAVTSEKEAVKKILDTNAQSSFKYFS